MTVKPTGKPWRGVVASLIFDGAGQFFSGARRRGLVWCAILVVAPIVFLYLLNLPFTPAKAWPFFIGLWAIAWVAMLRDSRRSIIALHWWGWILLILASLALSEMFGVAEHQLFRPFRIPTQSMAPTLSAGDHVFVSRSAYWFHEPRRGDIIVFGTRYIPSIPNDPAGQEVMYDKRVVGLPGDRVEILDPQIVINGVEMKFGDPAHPVKYQNRRKGIFDRGTESWVVPEGQYFVLGDNSANSFDSRYWGPIRREAIYGKVTKIYWPWGRTSMPR